MTKPKPRYKFEELQGTELAVGWKVFNKWKKRKTKICFFLLLCFCCGEEKMNLIYFTMQTLCDKNEILARQKMFAIFIHTYIIIH